MGNQVCSGANMSCAMGTSPGSLSVLPANMVNTGGPPGANIMDNVPMMNIAPFGMCQSPANPQVAAATAAAMGVLTPMPCIPMTTAPWIVGAPTVMLAKMPTLDDASMLMCNWGGVIQISFAGQATVQVP